MFLLSYEKYRSFLFRLYLFLAYIPGPVVWGALIDMSCILFQESCGETGNCLVYNTDQFRNVFYGSLLGLKSLDLILISSALAVIIYQLKKEKVSYSALLSSPIFFCMVYLFFGGKLKSCNTHVYKSTVGIFTCIK